MKQKLPSAIAVDIICTSMHFIQQGNFYRMVYCTFYNYLVSKKATDRQRERERVGREGGGKGKRDIRDTVILITFLNDTELNTHIVIMKL